MQLPLDKYRSWILPVALPAALFIALLWIYLAPLGTRTFTWEAGESSLLIGRPLPDARTGACSDTEENCVVFFDEPAYMSVTPPAGLWHEMHVEVSYRLNDQEKFEIGLMQDFALQSFALHQLEQKEEERGWSRAKTSFLLDGVQKELGAYKLIISLPGVEEVEEKPTIHALNVTFKRNTSVIGEAKWFIKGLWERRM